MHNLNYENGLENDVPWTYSQSTGQLAWNGQIVGEGYSGKGSGKNNPDMETVKNTGPIPKGQYQIGPSHYRQGKGPKTMALTPIGHTAHNRSAFLIHGDSRNQPGNASEGCIILPPHVRTKIANSVDNFL